MHLKFHLWRQSEINTIVEFKNVIKTYQLGNEEVTALNNIDLSIRQGEFVSIVGPSGAGKSTLLHMIGCVDTPTSGSLTIDNVQTSKLKENELAQLRNKKLGFVFQQFFLLPTLTALENVLLPTIFSPNGRAHEKQQKAKQILDLVDLSGRASHLPSQLSGGEMQRVAIARALINDPKILLADEPTGNLDSKNAAVVFAIFKKLHLAGLTIIVVTHDSELANRAEQSFHLKDGKILNPAL